MKIIAAEKDQNCFDGEFVFKYFIDTLWTKESIMYMNSLGQLKYYKSFPKPMFEVRCFDGTIIKGVEGTGECRVIFSRDEPTKAKENFEKIFILNKE